MISLGGSQINNIIMISSNIDEMHKSSILGTHKDKIRLVRKLVTNTQELSCSIVSLIDLF